MDERLIQFHLVVKIDERLIPIVLLCLIAGVGIGFAVGHNVFPKYRSPVYDSPTSVVFYIYGTNCTATYRVLAMGEDQSTMSETTVPANTQINVSRPANYAGGWWTIFVDGEMQPLTDSPLVESDFVEITATASNGWAAVARADYPSTKTRLTFQLNEVQVA